MRPNPWLVVVFVGAVAGATFASFSTYDFVAHLDRQVHGIHCSFLPGIEGTDVSGASGCHTTLMSPYSSVLRTTVWGGIPVSLPAMSVFSFLAFAAIFLWLTKREDTKSAWFLVAATALPALTSLGMGYLSLVTLDAACKMCIGIYISSGVSLLGALGFALTVGRRRAAPPRRGEDDLEAPPAKTESVERPAPASTLGLAAAFGIGVLFVAVPVGAYAATAPDFEHFVGACGELTKLEIADGVLVPLGPQSGGTEVIEVLDPLCPACRGFERRFEAAGFSAGASRRALLFPLDDECNWMISSAIHPGACAVSEAVLCAEDRAEEVLYWAFEEQDAIRQAAEDDPEAPARMATERFPFVADCVGTPTIRARLNLSLRFAVDNRMPIITPQVYVGGTRLCDEDTDLGMDYALTRLLERTGSGAPRVTTLESDELVAREVAREEAPQPVIRRQAPPATGETGDAESPEPAAVTAQEGTEAAVEGLGEATEDAIEAAAAAVNPAPEEESAPAADPDVEAPAPAAPEAAPPAPTPEPRTDPAPEGGAE